MATMRDFQRDHMCFMSAQNTYACVRAHTETCAFTHAHAFPAEDQSAERGRHRSIQTAKRLSVDASPALKQPITLSIVGRLQLSSQSAVKMLLQRSGCGTSPWHGFIVTRGVLSSVLIAFGTKFCVCGSDFYDPRSEGIVYELLFSVSAAFPQAFMLRQVSFVLVQIHKSVQVSIKVELLNHLYKISVSMFFKKIFSVSVLLLPPFTV